MPIDSQTIRMIRAQAMTLKFRMDRPRSISGWALEWRLYDKIGGTVRITKTTSGATITISDSVRGEISITISKGDTSGLTVTGGLSSDYGYVWELRRTDSGSEVVLARGELILLQEIFA